MAEAVAENDDRTLWDEVKKCPELTLTYLI